MSTTIGVCFPNTTPNTSLTVEQFALLPGSSVRVQANVGDPGRTQLLRNVRHAGKIPHVLLMPPNEQHPTQQYAATLAMAIEMLDDFPEIQVVELGNEPCYHTTQGEYADFANALAGQIRLLYQKPSIAVACDWVSADARSYIQGGRWWDGKSGLFSKTIGLKHLLDWSLFDLLAVHPYRPPLAPEESPLFGSRAKELAAYRQMAQGKGLIATETGWALTGKTGLPADTVGQYVEREVRLLTNAGYAGVFVYQHQGPQFGIFNDDWTERPAATALRRVVEERL